jgi:hypothetical protein
MGRGTLEPLAEVEHARGLCPMSLVCLSATGSEVAKKTRKIERGTPRKGQRPGFAARGSSNERTTKGARQFCRQPGYLQGEGWSGGACLSAGPHADGFPGAAGLAAAQCGDGVGAAYGPSHAGLLEAVTGGSSGTIASSECQSHSEYDAHQQ